ncbi:hypothetical protein TrLO_g9024 [Triparma laevis f. longispina]|uniref:Uncharacterized protein n=1 Tax=Triparma laevis f. longispina TaxID=1714387 RepID=A0A9W7FEB5_9STRA|nr:hypothetical protein TrLO_g9024 [Triparma laevis f. longispina]
MASPQPISTAPKKSKHPLEHFLAGGTAGLVESSCCHPLDTIKTRMQLRKQIANAKPIGPLTTAMRIINREGFFSLYKGLTAVYTGIIPKMSVRFMSFEQYKIGLGNTLPAGWGLDAKGNFTQTNVFTAGLMSGLTEAILVVTPAEVCKIRMQGQYHSMADPEQLARRKYTNVLQTATVIVREEGISALYKGIVPTMMRQGCNQAVNFTAYAQIKAAWTKYQGSDLASWQHLLIGGVSGGMGPTVNNPLDVVKTRMQKQVIIEGETAKYRSLGQSVATIAKEEGVLALWKGLTPRLMRIMPGQAITFMTYEAVSKKLHEFNIIPGV